MSPPIAPRLLEDLTHRSDRLGLIRLAGHALAIAAAAGAVLLLDGSIGVLPAMLALGILLVSLFEPLHQTTHRTPFASLRLNKTFGLAAGLILVLPPEWFRCFHMAHHRYVQDPERDPELATPKPSTTGQYLWVLTGIPYWLAAIRLVLGNALGRVDAPFIPATLRPAVIREARLFLIVYATVTGLSLFFGSLLAVKLWLVPVLLGQPVLRAVLLAEHTGLPLITDRFANTRTTLAGSFLRWLFWNGTFHAEHHLAPGVPFHALPRLHDLIRTDLKVIEVSLPAAHRTIRAGLE